MTANVYEENARQAKATKIARMFTPGEQPDDQQIIEAACQAGVRFPSPVTCELVRETLRVLARVEANLPEDPFAGL